MIQYWELRVVKLKYNWSRWYNIASWELKSWNMYNSSRWYNIESCKVEIQLIQMIQKCEFRVEKLIHVQFIQMIQYWELRVVKLKYNWSSWYNIDSWFTDTQIGRIHEMDGRYWLGWSAWLSDFSCYMIPKPKKMYQMNTKCTKCS
jgi:hypothetical protein